MDMCGVAPSREFLNIPIVGGFRASAYTAMMLARRFSIITILDNVIDMQLDHIHGFGLVNRFASIRMANAPVSELLEDPEITADRVLKEAYLAVKEDGAEAIILGCTGFIDVAEKVQKKLLEYNIDIPVLDPNKTAMSYLQLLVNNNLSQSKQTYMTPGRMIKRSIIPNTPIFTI